MNIEDAIKKYCEFDSIVYSIEHDDKIIALSNVNIAGGVCSCCSKLYVEHQEVVNIIDMETMEILYSRADQ
jgi:hypothetical protein